MNIRWKRAEGCTLLLTFLLATAFFASKTAIANAEGLSVSGDSADVPIKLTTQGASFTATVPTVLPYCASTDGTVMTTGCLKLINRSPGQIEVKKMAVELPEDWRYNQEEGDEDKVIRLIVQGEDVSKTGSVDLKEFEPIDGGDKLLLYVAACCDGSGIEDGIVEKAKLTIVLGWNKNNENEGENENENR